MFINHPFANNSLYFLNIILLVSTQIINVCIRMHPLFFEISNSNHLEKNLCKIMHLRDSI